MELLNGREVNIGKEFPTVFSNKKRNYDPKNDILKKTTHKIKDPDFLGNVVIMVNKKKSKKKRGKKKRKPPRKIIENKVERVEKVEKVDKSENKLSKHKESEVLTVVKGLNPSQMKNNNHKKWTQYHESVFFISNVIRIYICLNMP